MVEKAPLEFLSKRIPSDANAIVSDEVLFTSAETVNDTDVINIASDEMGFVKEILFVGAGTSNGIPNIACLAAEPPSCIVCLDSVGRVQRSAKYMTKHGGPPTNAPSRNRRTNPSAVIRYAHSDGTLHSVLIDCGKTFYANAIRTILKGGVRKLDGVLLTHGHADALLGLDDLRHWAGHWPSFQPYVDIYCDKSTFEVVKGTFPYIVDPKCATGGGEVSALRFHVFNFGDTIKIGELSVESLRVCHGSHSDGRDYYANGYKIAGLTYLSDISGIPEETCTKLGAGHTEILVADCLFEDRSYKSHYSWPQAAELIKWLAPKATILVGMAHSIDYYAFQRKLIPSVSEADGSIAKLTHTDGNVYVGFDGMTLRFS